MTGAALLVPICQKGHCSTAEIGFSLSTCVCFRIHQSKAEYSLSVVNFSKLKVVLVRISRRLESGFSCSEASWKRYSRLKDQKVSYTLSLTSSINV